jgi:hypothetical protein
MTRSTTGEFTGYDPCDIVEPECIEATLGAFETKDREGERRLHRKRLPGGRSLVRHRGRIPAGHDERFRTRVLAGGRRRDGQRSRDTLAVMPFISPTGKASERFVEPGTERPGDTASCPASNYRETKSVVTAGSWPIRANRRTTGASITESAGGSPGRSAGTTGPGRGRRIVQHSLTGGRSPKAAVRNGFSDRLADRQQGARSRVAERRGEQGSIGGPWLRCRLPESGEETGVAYEPAQSVSPSPWLGSNSPPQ